MLYKEIIKKLASRSGITLSKLAADLGISQPAFSQRLNDSYNPGIANTNEVLDKLGYVVMFAPKDILEKRPALADSCFVVELPKKK